MVNQLLALYRLMEDSSGQFAGNGLEPIAFMDVYRSQPLNAELYEYFSLPAIFVDYTMMGQGPRQARLITLTLHVVTDAAPEVSNISEQRQTGIKRFLYLLLLQDLLEGARLAGGTPLKFISEVVVDVDVVNYHIQTWQFEVFIDDMIPDVNVVFGEFEKLNITGKLHLRK